MPLSVVAELTTAPEREAEWDGWEKAGNLGSPQLQRGLLPCRLGTEGDARLRRACPAQGRGDSSVADWG